MSRDLINAAYSLIYQIYCMGLPEGEMSLLLTQPLLPLCSSLITLARSPLAVM